MGLYPDGNVCGVQWTLYLVHSDGTHTISVQFNRKYPQKLTIEQIREIEHEWNQLTEDEKKGLVIKFYTRNTDTYEIGSSAVITLWPGDRVRLEELFAKV